MNNALSGTTNYGYINVDVCLEDNLIEDRDVFFQELTKGGVSLLAVEIIPEYPKESGFSFQEFFEWCYELEAPSEDIQETRYSIVFVHEYPIRLSSKKMLDSIFNAYELSLAELNNRAEFQYNFWFRYEGGTVKRFVLERVVDGPIF